MRALLLLLLLLLLLFFEKINFFGETWIYKKMKQNPLEKQNLKGEIHTNISSNKQET